MHRVAVTAVGLDRPGIVAGVTGVFFDLGCNLRDCSMTRLSGQFAMILLVEAPDSTRREALQQALQGPAEKFELSVSVNEAAPVNSSPGARPHVISVYGADKPGIVHRVSAHLADRSVNITDLVSHVVGANIYTMVLEVDLPSGVDLHTLEQELSAVAHDLGVDISLRPLEIAEL